MTDQLPVTAPLPEVPPRARRHRVLTVVLPTLVVLVVTVVVAGFLVHLPYVIISPGSATPLDSQVVQIKGAPTYTDTSGDVRFLTVQVSTHEPNLWRLVAAWIDPNRDVQDRNTVQGCLTDTENRNYNADLMDQSQNDAKYVALTRLGYTVPANPVQIRVVEVCRGAPAYGKLNTGDQVLAVDGRDVSQGSEVLSAVQKHHPGDRVTITFDHNGVTHTVTITTGRFAGDTSSCDPVRAANARSGTACIGASSQEFVTYQFPIDIKINTQLVGGPSAGLAFTLAIIDDMTPGSLTGGKQVAVTGTVAPDGRVGEVGGVEQKAITARTNGVQLMIVPKKEVADARRGAGDVRVVGVDNVEQALDALHRAGGAAVPPPSTTVARS